MTLIVYLGEKTNEARLLLNNNCDLTMGIHRTPEEEYLVGIQDPTFMLIKKNIIDPVYFAVDEYKKTTKKKQNIKDMFITIADTEEDLVKCMMQVMTQTLSLMGFKDRVAKKLAKSLINVSHKGARSRSPFREDSWTKIVNRSESLPSSLVEFCYRTQDLYYTTCDAKKAITEILEFPCPLDLGNSYKLDSFIKNTPWLKEKYPAIFAQEDICVETEYFLDLAEIAAKRFLDNHDSNIADNDQMRNIIEDLLHNG